MGRIMGDFCSKKIILIALQYEKNLIIWTHENVYIDFFSLSSCFAFKKIRLNVAYVHNGILLSYKKKWDLAICNNIDKTWVNEVK